MKKLIIIGSIFLGLMVVAILLVKANVETNLTGKITSVDIVNVRNLLDPIADVNLTFEITNNSWFSFAVNDFEANIYNKGTGTFLTQNTVLKRVEIPIGISNHEVELLDNKILGNAAEFLQGDTVYMMLIKFRVFGMKVQFEQIVKL